MELKFERTILMKLYMSQDKHDKLSANYDPLPVANTSNDKNRFSFSA